MNLEQLTRALCKNLEQLTRALCKEFARTHEARAGWSYFTDDIRLAVLTSWVAHRLRDHKSLTIEGMLEVRDSMIDPLLNKHALRVLAKD